MKIEYHDNVDDLSPDQLTGFFVGWPSSPSPAKHLEILRGSASVCVAMDGDRCVGFVNALSDGVFYAYDLVTINTETAEITRIGSSELTLGTAIATGPDGQIYFLSNGTVAGVKTIDPDTGASTTVSGLSGAPGRTAKGLVWVDDTLYLLTSGVSHATAAAALSTIDLESGTATPVPDPPVLSNSLGAIAYPRLR